MKGLGISNSPMFRKAHNSLARYIHLSCLFQNWSLRPTPSPADLRGARNALATNALDALKSKTRTPKPPPPKTSKTRKPPVKPDTVKENEEESYHFIGYVPAFGKVWELVCPTSYLRCPLKLI